MKKLIAIAMAALMAVSLAGCGSASSSSAAVSSTAAGSSSASSSSEGIVEKIKARGKLVVGTEAQYAPFEFKDSKANFAGCDIWLAQQIADELGVSLEVMDMSFDGIIPAVKSGQVDLGIAAFTVTEERAKEIDFSDVYQQDKQLLIVKAGNENVYTTKESLAGKQVGAQKGTIQSLLIQSALPDSKLFELDKYPSLALEVANENIAGLVVDESVGTALVEANSNLAVANFEFDPQDANFGKAAVIAKGNDDLTEVVNTVIAKVLADGSFDAAYTDAVALAKTLGV